MWRKVLKWAESAEMDVKCWNERKVWKWMEFHSISIGNSSVSSISDFWYKKIMECIIFVFLKRIFIFYDSIVNSVYFCDFHGKTILYVKKYGNPWKRKTLCISNSKWVEIHIFSNFSLFLAFLPISAFLLNSALLLIQHFCIFSTFTNF